MDPTTAAPEPHEPSRADAEPIWHPIAREEVGSERVELGTYEIAEGTRLLSAQPVEDVIHVVDAPLGHPGETYLVETTVTSISELEALVDDYRSQAAALGDCPMRSSAIDPAENSLDREAIS